MARAKQVLAWSVLAGAALGLSLAVATPTRMLTHTGDDWRSHIPHHPDPGDWLSRRMASQDAPAEYGNRTSGVELASQSDPEANYWAHFYADADRAQRKAEAANREAGRKVDYPAASDEGARKAGLADSDPHPEPPWGDAPEPGPDDALETDEDGAREEPDMDGQ